MESETVRKITKITTTVLELLKSSNKDVNEIRKCASKELGMDLSGPSRRTFVSSLVELYLVELQAKEEADAEAEEKAEKRPKFDDSGDVTICKLSDNRKVVVTTYERQRMISIRDYYKAKNGEEKPIKRGITFTIETWACLKKKFAAIDDAIKEMQSRLPALN